MPAERYYLPSHLNARSTINLEEEEAHHLIRVMRTREGDHVELVNGRGVLANALVAKIGKHHAELTVLEIVREDPAPTPVIIAQALPKLNRIDVIVEKGTELGMTELWFYPGDLSEKKDVSPTQEKRFNNLAISAMKQCGCLWVPKIHYHPPLEDWSSLPCTGLYGDVAPAAPTLKTLWPSLPTHEGVIFFVGPEKGFSEKEVAHLKRLGVIGASLHKNILRTDTAPLCALSQIAGLEL